MIKIAFLGDVVPGGVIHYKDVFITSDLQNFLSRFDLRVATLECAIGDADIFGYDTTKMDGRMNIIHSLDSDISKIEQLNIDVVSLANNHVFDLGITGFQNTIRQLKENGIKYCGAGMCISEASAPAVIHYKGKSIAFLSFCEYNSPYIGHVPIATDGSPGINPLTLNNVRSSVSEAKKIYDYVFVIPHWGVEHSFFPTNKAVKLAYMMLDVGADAVVGGHPHQIQPKIKRKKKIIYFSLGNSMFPDFAMKPPRPIWYPPGKDFDFNSLKTINEYLFPIKEHCIRIWNHLGRVGMIAAFTLDVGMIKSNYYLTLNSKNNVVGLFKNTKYTFLLSIIGLLIKTPIYNLERLFRIVYRKHKRLYTKYFNRREAITK